MAKKATKRSVKSVRKKAVSKKTQYFGLDGDTVIIVGGGFLVIILIAMVLHR